ncbi:MAG: hypothetical protein J0M04_19120 [Verrucomicrobia bacterium]|nr:hypothetical protein [Verrucomicrobiota bacterium]
MIDNPQTIGTPLGDIQVRVTGADHVITDVFTPTIQLPAAMSVDSVVAVLIHISAVDSLSNVRCECTWDSAPAAGDRDTGECLDAQSWDSGGYRVTIGTEDFEALSRRLPNLGLTEVEYPVVYSDSGLAILIPTVPRDTEFSVHFVIAWRSLPDPEDCTTWFAVDIPHSKLEAANKSWMSTAQLPFNLSPTSPQ